MIEIKSESRSVKFTKESADCFIGKWGPLFMFILILFLSLENPTEIRMMHLDLAKFHYASIAFKVSKIAYSIRI